MNVRSTADSDNEPDAIPGVFSRIGRAVVAVLAAATLTTWMQLGLAALRREVFGSFSWKWWARDQVLWTSSGNLLLFAALSLVFIAAYTLWPRRFTFVHLVATLAAFALFFALLIFERIAPIAWCVVAVGAGVQCYRLIASRTRRTWRVAAAVALAGNAASAATVLLLSSQRSAGESKAVAALPAAQSAARNVLLIVLDTERAASMSLYGAPQPTTPKLDRRAQQGVVFDHAYATSSWTLPSHASMFTGRFPSEVGADWLRPLDDRSSTLAEVFRAHGYATGGFVANVNFTGYRTGLARGFLHYEDAPRSLRQLLFGTTVMQSSSAAEAFEIWDTSHWLGGALRGALRPVRLRPSDGVPTNDLKRASEIRRDFLTWLPSVTGHPFFVFLNFFDAHGPYIPPKPYDTMFDSTNSSYGRYIGAVRYLDDEVDEVLRGLEQRGVLDSTIVVIVADHGELFGEHSVQGHGNGLYRPQLHVPFVVLNAPGSTPGLRVRRAVTLRDLPATILDLAGIPNSGAIAGASLRGLLARDSASVTPSVILSELSPSFNPRALKLVPTKLKSLIDDSTHVIARQNGVEKLYDYPSDTAEKSSRASSAPGVREAATRLQRVIDSLGIHWDR